MYSVRATQWSQLFGLRMVHRLALSSTKPYHHQRRRMQVQSRAVHEDAKVQEYKTAIQKLQKQIDTLIGPNLKVDAKVWPLLLELNTADVTASQRKVLIARVRSLPNGPAALIWNAYSRHIIT